MLLTQSLPIASYFTRVALVFLVCVSMLLLLFVPKIRLMAESNRESQTRETVVPGAPTAQNTDPASRSQSVDKV